MLSCLEDKADHENDDDDDDDSGASPTHTDIKSGNAAEDADLAATGGIQDENAIVGDQLSGAAVEEEKKKHLSTRLISRPSTVSDPEFTAHDAMEQGAGFRSRENRSLNGDDRGLRQDAFFLCVRRVKKLFEPLPAQGDFRIIRSRRHQRVVCRPGAGRELNEAEQNRADKEEGKSKLFHFWCKTRLYRAIPEERSNFAGDGKRRVGAAWGL
jgi:hypothetical protein